MRRFSCSASAFALVLAACGTTQQAPASFAMTLTVIPEDLGTGERTAVPAASIDAQLEESAFLEGDGALVPESFEVVTWPEGAPVEGRVELRERPLPGARYVYEFVPTSALEPRWYALRFDLARFGTRLSRLAPSPDPALESGTIVNRFYRGSLPLVGLEVYGDAEREGAYIIQLRAAEPLALAPGAGPLLHLIQVTVDGRVATTELWSPSGADAALYNAEVNIRSAEITIDSTIEVHIAPGIVGRASGVPLRDLEARTDIQLRWNLAEGGNRAPREPSAALLALSGDAR